jgi:hypothetical protein
MKRHFLFSMAVSTSSFHSYDNYREALEEFDKRAFSPLPTDNYSAMVKWGIVLLRVRATALRRIQEHEQEGVMITSRYLPSQEVIKLAISSSENAKFMRMIDTEIQRCTAFFLNSQCI